MKDIADALNRIAEACTTARLWSPTPTEECPVTDHLKGGFCESDEQLRIRLKNREK